MHSPPPELSQLWAARAGLPRLQAAVKATGCLAEGPQQVARRAAARCIPARVCLFIYLFVCLIDYLFYIPDLGPPHSRRCSRGEPAEDEWREGGGRPPRCPLPCPGAGPETTLPLPSSMTEGSPRSCLLEAGGCSPCSDPRGAEYLHRPLSEL